MTMSGSPSALSFCSPVSVHTRCINTEEKPLLHLVLTSCEILKVTQKSMF